MRFLYILKGKIPVAIKDTLEWGEWFETADRIVKQEHINTVQISTVFLAVDHAYQGNPLLFETMIFGGEHDEYQTRYSTWDQAEEGHQAAVEMVRRSMLKTVNQSI